mmetsp:Transcript_27909/g.54944  ORF Transcript_27909/g.54944 Transcript_27909/m.54944 type:complete len:90 (-) Transcript_27909:60-329(-)
MEGAAGKLFALLPAGALYLGVAQKQKSGTWALVVPGKPPPFDFDVAPVAVWLHKSKAMKPQSITQKTGIKQGEQAGRVTAEASEGKVNK